MTYRKFVVDNVTCSRRFHMSFDDEDSAITQVHVKCLHCGVTVFAAKNHQPVKFARDENLVKTTALAELTISECHFRDTLSERTIPKSKIGQVGPMYPSNSKA